MTPAQKLSDEEFDMQLRMLVDNLDENTGGACRENRRHALTKPDAEFIINLFTLLVRYRGCSLGFTDKQADVVRTLTPEHLTILRLLKWAIGLFIATMLAAVVNLLPFVNWWHKLMSKLSP